MNIRKARPALIAGILIAIFFFVALFLRVYLPYDQIFVGDWIKYSSNDAYYHMRLVDNLVSNFPNHTSIDPYFIYPNTTTEALSIRFFDWLLAGIIWIIGLGNPSQHTIDIVGIYFPAVLGALTVIPVYFIGKEIAGRWAGILSAGLLTLLGGEFISRSILGFTDQHIAETLFSTTAIMFLILAIKAARQGQFTLNNLNRQDIKKHIKPVIYSLLAGVFLGIYILTWAGALLFVSIILVYFIIQFVVDNLKGENTDYLCLTGFILFLITLIISLPSSLNILLLVALIIAMLVPPVLSGLSRLTAGKEAKPVDSRQSKSANYTGLGLTLIFAVALLVLMMQELNLAFMITGLVMLPVVSTVYWLMVTGEVKRLIYPLTIIAIGLAGWGVLYLANPSLLDSALSALSVLTPTETQLTTTEMQPLIAPQVAGGSFIDTPAWGNFNISFVLSLISLLGLIIYFVIKRETAAERTLLIVWSLIILAAALGQRRFAYYFAVNVALLTGYLSWYILRLVGFREKATEIVEKAKARPVKKNKGGINLTTSHINMGLALLLILLIVYCPNFLISYPNDMNLVPVYYPAQKAYYAPTDAWCESLSWMKENTPDPMGDPDAYYGLQELPETGESYVYPESAYGVLAWWDYGYRITRVAHRIPNTNPSQDTEAVERVASFFISQDEETAGEIIEGWDSRYVIVDYDTGYIEPSTASGKLSAMAIWAGVEFTEFFDVYLWPEEDALYPVIFYHPEYYRSLAVRLYSFDGEAVTPESSLVISYEEYDVGDGSVYKRITNAQEFTSYEEAETYLLAQESGNHRIVGSDPLSSPVPLEALKNYSLVYDSEYLMALSSGDTIPEVKIFEHTE